MDNYLCARTHWILIVSNVSNKLNLFFQYTDQERVALWVNKVGPYYNPQETYNYYSLPFCLRGSENPIHKWGGLGEVLEGNELIDSQIDIKFKRKVI